MEKELYLHHIRVNKNKRNNMKTHHLVIGLLSLFLLGACSSNPIEKRATGLAYEIVVTMDPALWKGEVGEAIKADLASEVLGLPQSEPALRITFVGPEHFNGLLTYVRNIFVLNIDPQKYTQTSLSFERDIWANGQLVLMMNSPSAEDAIAYANAHPKAMVNFFVKEEMTRAASQYQRSYSQLVYEKVKGKFDVTLKVSDDMTFFKDTTDFFWASNNANTGRIDVVVYSFPYTDPETFTLDYLIAKRDSAMKANLPGSFPNSYMTTSTNYAMPTYTPITVNGKYTGVLRGLWRMEGDMMGGPFVSHARLDEVNNRVIVAEGFVYAPETSKRNYIRRIEAALYTMVLPGETSEIQEVQTIPAAQIEEKE